LNHYTIVLLPHQDDEIAIYHELEKIRLLGQPLLIMFLTTNTDLVISRKRINESSMVLKRLGFDDSQIIDIGTVGGFFDGKLCQNIESCFDIIVRVIEKTVSSRSFDFISPGYEGGHPDHDAAYLLASALKKKYPRSRQKSFYLYNNSANLYPFFSIFKPIDKRNIVEEMIPVLRRLFYLNLICKYRTQWTTFLGLMPFIVLFYILKGSQVMTIEERFSSLERPHSGRLYYECRGFMSFDQFVLYCRDFVIRKILLRR